MASVRLEGWRGVGDELPAVCATCGADATTHKTRAFAWFPPWVYVLLPAGLLPYAIVANVMTKRMNVDVPFCDAHAGHFWKRALLMLAGVLLFLAPLVAGIAVSGPGNDALFTALLLTALFGFLCWIALIVVLKLTEIRPTEITDDSITLTSVSPAFVEALEEEMSNARRRRRDLDREAEERWSERRPRRDDDADDRDRYRERRRRSRQEDDDAPRDQDDRYRRDEE
jgi:hypothetical protein